MITRRRAAVAGVTLLVILLAAPGRAAATDPRPSPWPAAPCATGAVTEVTTELVAADLGADGGWQVSVHGWIQPCTETETPAGFAVLRYYATAAMFAPTWWSLGLTEGWQYESVTAPTTFTVTTRLDAGPRGRHGPLRAICVVRTEQDPVACTAIEQPDGHHAPVSVPIPPDDPRVTSVPLTRERHGGWEPNPGCGSCV